MPSICPVPRLTDRVMAKTLFLSDGGSRRSSSTCSAITAPMRCRPAFLSCLLGLGAAALAAGELPPPAAPPVPPPADPAPTDAALPGLKVGDKAVDFTLKNAAGQEVSLQSLLQQGRVALLFYRSGDWCPICIAQLQGLQQNLKAITATGVQLVGVSCDSPAVLTEVAKRYSLTFPLLSDAGSKTIDAYGIRNHEATGRAVGVPHPVIYILDQAGIIRARLMRANVRERPTPAEIIAAAGNIK